MDFYFYPNNEENFKNSAVGNFVQTIVFDKKEQKIIKRFSRKVKTHWKQTCKNNIESDQRIKELNGENYQIYSWVSKSKADFALPSLLHGVMCENNQGIINNQGNY